MELLEKAGADKDDITVARSRLQASNRAYVEFSKEMGFRQQRERLRISNEIPETKLGAGSSEGGAPGKPELLGQIDPKDADRAIEYYNKQIRNEEVEHSFVIDRSGNVYYSLGGKDNVSLEGIDLKGATITHNHPVVWNGVTSFGEDDFYVLQDNPDIRELIAVNDKFTYHAEPLNGITAVSYHNFYVKAMQEAEQWNPDFDLQHKVFEILDREGIVKYAREKFISRTEKED